MANEVKQLAFNLLRRLIKGGCKMPDNFSNSMILDMKYRIILCCYWIVIALSVLFKDMHDLFIPDFFSMLSTGIIDGNEVTEGMIFAGSLFILLFLTMVPVNLLLSQKIVFISNIVAITLLLLTTFVTDVRDMDDYLFRFYSLTISFGIVLFSYRLRNIVESDA